MKATLRIFRLPRKIVIIIGGILLLGGATGALALYIGKDRLLGHAEADANGLECVTVKTFKIKKTDRYWIRKFIRTDAADGLSRVRTALRVANAVYAAQKPDLVQVVVLDKNGPEQRADMRGRAVGADVVYVPHPEKLADLAGTPVYAAKYIDGVANDSGQFYGEKIQISLEDINQLVAALKDSADCIDPSMPADAKKDEPAHGEAPAGEKHAPEAEHPAVSEHPPEGAGNESVSLASGAAETALAHASPEAEAPAEAPVDVPAGEAHAAELVTISSEAAAEDDMPPSDTAEVIPPSAEADGSTQAGKKH